MIYRLSLTSVLLLLAVPAQARVLAVCGASTGKAYYVRPKATGWVDDAVTNGSLIFLIDDAGKPDILVKDAYKKTFSIKDDGSTLVAPFVNVSDGTFTFIMAGNNGGVGTYQLTITKGGQKVLLWTDTKNRAAGVISKVAAYTAKCENGPQ